MAATEVDAADAVPQTGNMESKKCPLCHTQFPDISHLKSHSCLNMFCNICEERFPSAEELVSHLKLHDKNMVYFCAKCQQTFDDSNTFCEHKMRCGANRTYPAAKRPKRSRCVNYTSEGERNKTLVSPKNYSDTTGIVNTSQQVTVLDTGSTQNISKQNHTYDTHVVHGNTDLVQNNMSDTDLQKSNTTSPQKNEVVVRPLQRKVVLSLKSNTGTEYPVCTFNHTTTSPTGITNKTKGGISLTEILQKQIGITRAVEPAKLASNIQKNSPSEDLTGVRVLPKQSPISPSTKVRGNVSSPSINVRENRNVIVIKLTDPGDEDLQRKAEQTKLKLLMSPRKELLKSVGLPERNITPLPRNTDSGKLTDPGDEDLQRKTEQTKLKLVTSPRKELLKSVGLPGGNITPLAHNTDSGKLTNPGVEDLQRKTEQTKLKLLMSPQKVLLKIVGLPERNITPLPRNTDSGEKDLTIASKPVFDSKDDTVFTAKGPVMVPNLNSPKKTYSKQPKSTTNVSNPVCNFPQNLIPSSLTDVASTENNKKVNVLIKKAITLSDNPKRILLVPTQSCISGDSPPKVIELKQFPKSADERVITSLPGLTKPKVPTLTVPNDMEFGKPWRLSNQTSALQSQVNLDSPIYDMEMASLPASDKSPHSIINTDGSIELQNVIDVHNQAGNPAQSVNQQFSDNPQFPTATTGYHDSGPSQMGNGRHSNMSSQQFALNPSNGAMSQNVGNWQNQQIVGSQQYPSFGIKQEPCVRDEVMGSGQQMVRTQPMFNGQNVQPINANVQQTFIQMVFQNNDRKLVPVQYVSAANVPRESGVMLKEVKLELDEVREAKRFKAEHKKESKSKPYYFCELCSQYFCTEPVYAQHCSIHNRVQLCTCNICEGTSPPDIPNIVKETNNIQKEADNIHIDSKNNQIGLRKVDTDVISLLDDDDEPIQISNSGFQNASPNNLRGNYQMVPFSNNQQFPFFQQTYGNPQQFYQIQNQFGNMQQCHPMQNLGNMQQYHPSQNQYGIIQYYPQMTDQYGKIQQYQSIPNHYGNVSYPQNQQNVSAQEVHHENTCTKEQYPQNQQCSEKVYQPNQEDCSIYQEYDSNYHDNDATFEEEDIGIQEELKKNQSQKLELKNNTVLKTQSSVAYSARTSNRSTKSSTHISSSKTRSVTTSSSNQKLTVITNNNPKPDKTDPCNLIGFKLKNTCTKEQYPQNQQCSEEIYQPNQEDCSIYQEDDSNCQDNDATFEQEDIDIKEEFKKTESQNLKNNTVLKTQSSVAYSARTSKRSIRSSTYISSSKTQTVTTSSSNQKHTVITNNNPKRDKTDPYSWAGVKILKEKPRSTPPLLEVPAVIKPQKTPNKNLSETLVVQKTTKTYSLRNSKSLLRTPDMHNSPAIEQLPKSMESLPVTDIPPKSSTVDGKPISIANKNLLVTKIVQKPSPIDEIPQSIIANKIISVTKTVQKPSPIDEIPQSIIANKNLSVTKIVQKPSPIDEIPQSIIANKNLSVTKIVQKPSPINEIPQSIIANKNLSVTKIVQKPSPIDEIPQSIIANKNISVTKIVQKPSPIIEIPQSIIANKNLSVTKIVQKPSPIDEIPQSVIANKNLSVTKIVQKPSPINEITQSIIANKNLSVTKIVQKPSPIDEIPQSTMANNNLSITKIVQKPSVTTEKQTPLTFTIGKVKSKVSTTDNNETYDKKNPVFNRSTTRVQKAPSTTETVTKPQVKGQALLKARYNCHFCKKLFSEFAELMKHKDVCNTGASPTKTAPSTNSVENLSKKYQKNEQKAGRVRCELCRKTFKTKLTLKKHSSRTCNPEVFAKKPFPCDVCNKRFVAKTEVTKHILKNHSKVYTCDMCGGRFGTKKRIRSHIIRHSKPLHTCVVCQKQYTLIDHLLTHERTSHTDDKSRKHACQKCDAKFANLATLMFHQRSCGIPVSLVGQTILKPREYACRACGMKFSQNHRRIEHEADVCNSYNISKLPHVCAICRERFPSEEVMARHVLAEHENRVACKYCPERFSEDADLQTHIQRHEKLKFPCVVCCEFLDSMRELYDHESSHEDVVGDHACRYCKRRFLREPSLNYHIRHDCTKALDDEAICYTCPLCYVNFAGKQELVEHKRYLCDKVKRYAEWNTN